MSKLTVVIAGEIRDYESKLKKAGAATDKFGNTVDRNSKRATLSLGGIGKAAKLAGGAFVFKEGIEQIKSLTDAAAASEVSQKRMAAQLGASGISYKAHAKEIDAVIQKTSKLAALDDEDLQDAFTNIVRTTGDVSQSLKLTGLAADLARGKHMDVAKAGEIVGKVAGGNVGILRRYGIQLDKNANSALALATLQSRFAGQARDYGKTSAGALDRLSVSSENLKESLGSALTPALTTGANKLSTFVDQMQTGKGAGGEFAHTMGEVADGAKEVYDEVKPIAASVARFTGQHPEILKVAGGLVAVSVAVKGIRFAGAVTGLSSFLSLAGRAGAGPGRAIGSKMAGGIASGLSAAKNSLTSRLTTTLSSAGSSAGAGAADATATSLAGDLRGGKSLGRFRSAGGVAGRAFGRAVTAGALVAVVGIGIALADKINSEFTDALQELGLKRPSSGATANGMSTVPGQGAQGGPLGYLKDKLGGLLGKRRGGIIAHRFQTGGMMPAFVSPGEDVHYGDQVWTVPGARTSEDSVFTHLPVGAAVLTDSGKSMLRQGASLGEAVAMQAPHFAKGGIVRGRTSTFGPPGEAAGRTASGLSSSTAGIALNIQPGTDSGWNNTTTDAWVRARQRFNVSVAGHSAVLPVIDKGPAGFTKRAIDITGAGARAMGINPASFPTDATGTATMTSAGMTAAGGRTLLSAAVPAKAAVYRTVLGERYKGSARTEGFDAGLDGAVRLPADLTASIIAGGIGRRDKVSDAVKAQPARYSAARSAAARKATGSHTELKPGISALAGTVLGRYPGLKITSTTGGRHAAGSYHYQGRAVDLGGTQSVMDYAAGWIRDNLGSRLLEGIHKSNLAIKNGKKVSGPGVYGSVWDEHRNHIHMAARRGGIVPGFRKGGTLGSSSPGRSPYRSFYLWAKYQKHLPARMGSGQWYNALTDYANAIGDDPNAIKAHFGNDTSDNSWRFKWLQGKRFRTGGRVFGGSVSKILGAGTTDASGTTEAFSHLVTILADQSRSTFADLSRLISQATARALKERKAGDKVDARRLDSIANLARAQQGIRLARPLVKTQALMDAGQRADSLFSVRQRLAGVDPGSLDGLVQAGLATGGQIDDLQGQRASLSKALARAKKVKNTKAIAAISKSLQDLDDTILDKRASLAELNRQIPRQGVLEDMSRYSSKLGWSSLVEQAARFTPGAEDDRNAALGRRGILAGQEQDLQRAIAGASARGDTSFADELVQQLLSVRDEMHSLDDTVSQLDTTIRYSSQTTAIASAKTAQVIAQVDSPDDLTDDIKALKDELAAATDAYNLARQANDAASIEQYGSEIVSLRGSIEQLTEATTNQTAILQAQLDMAKQQADEARRIAGVAQAETGALGRALASLVAGELGGRVGLGLQTPAYAGGGQRY